MAKKYKSGVVFGKLMPCTKGHQYLINTALNNCDKVTVIVCSVIDEPIPGELRFGWVKEIYKNEKRINIVHCSEELPQYPEEDKATFWCLWADVIRRYSPEDIDCLFTSEEYGEPFSKYLGTSHYLVDLKRETYPVSGTAVRKDPFGNWRHLPDVVKKYYIKRIAIVGPESVGKSTLTKNLATYFSTNFVDEYGRFVYEHNGNKVSIDDFILISEGRQELENWVSKYSNRVVFCDTEDISTYVASQMYYPEQYYKVHDFFKKKMESSRRYDLYILLDPGVPAVQDGTRGFLNDRIIHYEMIKEELIRWNCKFVEVGGNHSDRFLSAKKLTKAILKDW